MKHVCGMRQGWVAFRIDLVHATPNSGVLVATCLALLLSPLGFSQSPKNWPDELKRITMGDPVTTLKELQQQRPTVPDAATRAQVLASLPLQGEVKKMSYGERSSLSALAAVLRAHGRQSIYEVKIIPAPQMFVGLHARMVVLISQTTLRLLRPHELQALVAHEIGHEYVWYDYERAVERHDVPKLRNLELYCDAIALITLHESGLDASALIHAIEKIAAYNRARFGLASNEDSYPTVAERKTFARAMRDSLRRWDAERVRTSFRAYPEMSSTDRH